MESRARVLKALRHEQTDRIPIDLGGLQSGIHIRAYKKLLNFLDMEEDIEFTDAIQYTAKPSQLVLDRIHADVGYLYLKDSIMPEHFEFQISDDGIYRGIKDQFGVFWGEDRSKPRSEILYLDPVGFPLADCKTPNDVHDFDWPDGTDLKPFRSLGERAIELRRRKVAISTPPMANTYEYTNFLFGFTRSLVLFRKKPEIIVAAMQELVKYWKDYIQTFYDSVNGNVDIICINGDLSEQAGPIMNPAIYRKYVKPLDKEIADFVKDLGNLRINYHSCGSVVEFIPDFIDIGYDAINPVQLGAYQMELDFLKEKFGDEIAFWGGLCKTEILAFGSPEDVKKEVERNVKIFGKDGGYVGANIHNITAEVPPENIIAMFDTAYETGRNL